MGKHWGLTYDPFLPGSGPFFAGPSHAEAVERLVHAAETGERLVSLRASSGLGKSRVLTEVFDRLRSPRRRLVRVMAPPTGVTPWDPLARKFASRQRSGNGNGPDASWRGLADAVKLCRWQGIAVVWAVDDCQNADPSTDWRRLAQIDPHPSTQLTLMLVGDEPEFLSENSRPWDLAIGLDPLSRDETGRYLDAKLADAGRVEPAFTPRAVARIQLLAAGLPRGVDRLASLALMAGALRRLEIVTPDLVDGVARECVPAEC